MSAEKLVEGSSVRFPDGRKGVIVSAYWAHRDRYTVRHEDGRLLDYCSESILALPVSDDYRVDLVEDKPASGM